MFEEQVLKTIKKFQLIRPGETIVAAVSGGSDSVAMLHVLMKLTSGWGVRIHVAHLNHMLRGEEADREAAFVEEMARIWSLPCTVQKIDVTAFRRATGASIEEAAREVRYSFLRQVAKDKGAKGIFTAHHADDQAETLLLHLVRGAGPEGLAAISPGEGDLCRPLLEVTKEEILAYCREEQLAFCTDLSNFQTDFLRNRIRLQLIPLLKEYNPQVVQALAKTAEITRGENELLNGLTIEALDQIITGADDRRISIDLVKLGAFPLAMQRRAVRAAFDQISGKQGGLDFYQTERVLALSTGKEISLSGGIRARRDYERLILGNFQNYGSEEAVLFEPVTLAAPGRTEIPQLGIAVEVAIRSFFPEDSDQEKWQAVFPGDILGQPLLVRTRRPGDRIPMRGSGSRKKLKKFLMEHQVSRNERERIPLILSGERIIWVVGLRAFKEPAGGKDPETVVISVKKLSTA